MLLKSGSAVSRLTETVGDRRVAGRGHLPRKPIENAVIAAGVSRVAALKCDQEKVEV